MKWLGLSTVALFACGSVSSNPDASAQPDARIVDAATLDGATPDAPLAPRCNPTGAFQTPAALSSINTELDELNAVLSADELTLYFCSNRSGGLGNLDVWSATRTSTAAAWGTAQIVPGVNTAARSECITSMTADGLTMYLFTYTANGMDIAISTRASTTATWSALSIASAPLNSAGAIPDAHGRISRDGNTLYFSSSRADPNYTTTKEDLYVAQRTNGTWGLPVSVAGIPTNALEVKPVFSADELQLFYESYTTKGEIMLATRASKTAPFTGIQPQTVFNTADNDEGPDYLTADGCELYFTRGSTNADLFVSKRSM